MKNNSANRNPTIHQYSAPPPCPVCGDAVLLRLARGRKSGKAFVMLRCRQDGRHFRAFINDSQFVEYVIERLETKK